MDFFTEAILLLYVEEVFQFCCYFINLKYTAMNWMMTYFVISMQFFLHYLIAFIVHTFIAGYECG